MFRHTAAILLTALFFLAACSPAPTALPTSVPSRSPTVLVAPLVATETNTPPAPSPADLFSYAPGTRFIITLSSDDPAQQKVVTARFQNGSGTWIDYQPETGPLPTVSASADVLQKLVDPVCMPETVDLQIIEAALGYPVLLPGWLPEGYMLECVSYQPATNGISLQYKKQGSEPPLTFTLVEQQDPYLPHAPAFFGRVGDIPLNIVPSDVQVGEGWGKYVQGMWTIMQNSPTERELLWMQAPNGPARLRWQLDGRFMEILDGGCLNTGCLDKATLAKIAEAVTEPIE